MLPEPLSAPVSGLIFIAVLGIVMAPITHLVLQKFHVDQEGDTSNPRPRRP